MGLTGLGVKTHPVEPVASPALLREFAVVLEYDHLPLGTNAPGTRTRALERVAGLARVVEPAVRIDVPADPDDDAVLECALAAAADVLVFDDAHLRALDGIAGIEVCSREAFLDRYAHRRVAALARRA